MQSDRQVRMYIYASLEAMRPFMYIGIMLIKITIESPLIHRIIHNISIKMFLKEYSYEDDVF